MAVKEKYSSWMTSRAFEKYLQTLLEVDDSMWSRQLRERGAREVKRESGPTSSSWMY